MRLLLENVKMGGNPQITVIIPTYRRARLLKRAIGSVLRQTFINFKVCIYDNASSDETRNIVHDIMRTDDRVAYHCHEHNIGGAKNFQYGLMRVDTPFFSFLSDDDFLLPNFFDIALAGFINYPEAAFSAGSVVTMTDQGKILYEPFSLWEEEGLFIPPQGLLKTLREKYPIWTGILFRREVIKLTGGLDEEIGPLDLDFVYRISAKAPFVISKEPVAVCVNHETSSSALPALSAYWPSWLKMIRHITDDPEIPQSVKDKFETELTEQIVAELSWIGIRRFEKRDFNMAARAADILTGELNQDRKGRMLDWLVCRGRESTVFWRAVVAVIVLRRSLASLINFRRRRLQKKHGHLAVHLNDE